MLYIPVYTVQINTIILLRFNCKKFQTDSEHAPTNTCRSRLSVESNLLFLVCRALCTQKIWSGIPYRTFTPQGASTCKQWPRYEQGPHTHGTKPPDWLGKSDEPQPQIHWQCGFIARSRSLCSSAFVVDLCTHMVCSVFMLLNFYFYVVRGLGKLILLCNCVSVQALMQLTLPIFTLV